METLTKRQYGKINDYTYVKTVNDWRITVTAATGAPVSKWSIRAEKPKQQTITVWPASNTSLNAYLAAVEQQATEV